jgi:tetratricopeptide (TPR) repeat protein
MLAGLLATALVLGPTAALAEPPGTTVDELFPYGQEKFDAGDYDEAAAAWAKAARLLPEDKKNGSTRATLVGLALNAYLEAYGKDEAKRAPIDEAKKLLDEYEQGLQSAKGAVELTPDIADAKQRIDEALAQIQKREEEEAARLAAEEAERNKPVEEPPPPPPKKKPGLPFIIGGGVSLGLMVGGVAVLAVGVVNAAEATDINRDANSTDAEREAAVKQGNTANDLMAAGAVLGGVFLAAGVALIVVGVLKNKKAASGNAMLVPTLGRNYAGVGFTLRF